jgi:DNA replication protein DnaC
MQITDPDILRGQAAIEEKRRHLPTPPQRPFVATDSLCEHCGAVRPFLTFGPVTTGVPEACSCPGAQAARDVVLEAERQGVLEGERQKQLALEQARMSDIKRFLLGIPEGLRGKTFDAFTRTHDNHKGLDIARDYSDSFPSPHGLIFFGPVGTGKTHLTLAICLAQIAQGRSAIFGTVSALLDTLRATFDGGSVKEADVVRALRSCSLLAIDDLGKEKPTDWVEAQLFDILNYRLAHAKPVIITCNMGLEAVEKRYVMNGPAIVSRIHEMCRGVTLRGEDWRKRR